jgi:fatty acid kinase
MSGSGRLTSSAFCQALLEFEGSLKQNEARLNELNLWPIPDGDTGTNMVRTMEAASAEVRRLPSDACLSAVIRAARDGAFSGSLGCSGLLLFVTFRALADAWDGQDDVGPGDIGNGFEGAYRGAVESISPIEEGTLVSVLREAGRACLGRELLNEALGEAVAAAQAVVAASATRRQLAPGWGREDAGARGMSMLISALRRAADSAFEDR